MLEVRWRVSKISFQVPIRLYNGELMHWRCSYIYIYKYIAVLIETGVSCRSTRTALLWYISRADLFFAETEVYSFRGC